MTNHDRYETDILKALQRIATSLDKIEKHLSSKSTKDVANLKLDMEKPMKED